MCGDPGSVQSDSWALFAPQHLGCFHCPHLHFPTEGPRVALVGDDHVAEQKKEKFCFVSERKAVCEQLVLAGSMQQVSSAFGTCSRSVRHYRAWWLCDFPIAEAQL